MLNAHAAACHVAAAACHVAAAESKTRPPQTAAANASARLAHGFLQPKPCLSSYSSIACNQKTCLSSYSSLACKRWSNFQRTLSSPFGETSFTRVFLGRLVAGFLMRKTPKNAERHLSILAAVSCLLVCLLACVPAHLLFVLSLLLSGSCRCCCCRCR